MVISETPGGPPARPYTLAIVGGGIGGLCLAISLLHHNIPITIYEAASQFAEIGAGVSLGPNAQRAMSLIDPRIKEGFDRCATNNAYPENRRFWFQFRLGQDRAGGMGTGMGTETGAGRATGTGTHVYDLECETGQTSVHRAHFLNELEALIPEGVAVFGKRLEGYVDDGEGVTLRFKDGSSARHSALIGCDGIKSRTRQLLLGEDDPAANPVFSGKYAYRGLVPMHEAAALLGDELARNSQLYMGHHGHLLTFPIEKGNTMNVVAFQAKRDGVWEGEWVQPMQKSDMRADFSGWVHAVQGIISLMRKPDVWALFEHLPAHRYWRGRVAVMGDAAHATTPHQGAGAGMAIEDALVLGSALGLVWKAADLPKAFEAFDAVQRPRSQRLVTTSHEGGMLYEMELPGVEGDVEKIKDCLGSRMQWIWDVDLQANVKMVKALVSETVS